MDFAPYQDQSPETNRALSPPPPSEALGRRSFSPPASRRSFSPNLPNLPNLPTSSNPNHQHKPSNPWAGVLGGVVGGNAGHGGGGEDLEGGGRGGRLNEFETSLPIRMDFEACLAYLFLPPAGGVLLLVLEQKSDYVRFHAWQSSLLFSAVFVLHLIFSWSRFLSWVLFIGDLGLIGFLVFRAYKDADTLDRCEVPFFGKLASSILDDE